MKIKAVDFNEFVEQTKLMKMLYLTLYFFPLLVKVFIMIYYIQGKTCYSSTCA